MSWLDAFAHEPAPNARPRYAGPPKSAPVEPTPEKRRSPVSVTPALVAAIRERRGRGEPVRKVAAALGVSLGLVAKLGRPT